MVSKDKSKVLFRRAQWWESGRACFAVPSVKELVVLIDAEVLATNDSRVIDFLSADENVERIESEDMLAMADNEPSE